MNPNEIKKIWPTVNQIADIDHNHKTENPARRCWVLCRTIQGV